ncbi:MAG: hypothetical protein IJS71_08260 [Clostridia bacterium]|nr:hypothetical protein [Clostridia bacterium]
MTTYYNIPTLNDSFNRQTVDGEQYYFRFTYNVEGDFWTFGLWADFDNLIFATKLVPNIPLNRAFSAEGMPKGTFYCLSEVTNVINKGAIMEGAATFAYVPEGEELTEE